MPGTSGDPGLFRSRARPLLGVALLGILALPLVAGVNHVEVVVDGERTRLRTYAGAVVDVLERLDVTVGDADGLSHDLHAPVEEGMVIEVVRASTVEVHVDGRLADRVTAPVQSVAGVLTEAGLEDARELDAVIVPGWTSPVADGDVVQVWLPHSVSVEVDGRDLQLASLVSDVDALLLEHGIELGDQDEISVDPATPLHAVERVVIERVDDVEEVEHVVLERGEQERETDELERGTTRVEDEGSDGLREDVFRITTVDGEEAERELISQVVVEEPRPRIVLVGTAEPAPAPREESPGPSEGSGFPDPPGAPPADDPVWERLAHCESRGNWRNVSANGLYYGGLQFHRQTWRGVGGTGMPHEASREEQIYRAQLLQARSGWGQWPACSSRLGLR